MKRLMVQYRVKPERAGENEQYIERVFEELRRNSPADFRYAAFKQGDGVSFVHILFGPETPSALRRGGGPPPVL